MDYEKKYNEAMNDMRVIYPNLKGDAKLAVEHAFPELRESEDERIRKALVWHLKADVDFVSNGVTKAECIAYLEKQKEQKPAEWSEEDADILNCCISSIEEAKENRYAYKETDGDTSYDREIAFLKSIRPSWKPSEEHLSALLAVFNDPNNIGSQTCQLALTDLYEQLKKL